jgi:LysR family glycine cleavage system transcriptional activator
MPAPDLPTLTALRAFDAVARRSSFKAAAEDLFVTPTAISHQIRQLEAHLSVRVLNRTARAVTLTAEGRVLYAATASGFAEIAKAVALLRQRQDSTVLTLSSTATDSAVERQSLGPNGSHSRRSFQSAARPSSV